MNPKIAGEIQEEQSHGRRKLLTYAEAAVLCGCRAKSAKHQAKFISRRVARREIDVVDLGHSMKRISEFGVLKFLASRTTPAKQARKT